MPMPVSLNRDRVARGPFDLKKGNERFDAPGGEVGRFGGSESLVVAG